MEIEFSDKLPNTNSMKNNSPCIAFMYRYVYVDRGLLIFEVILKLKNFS